MPPSATTVGRRPLVRERVYADLKAMIVNGELAPGTRLEAEKKLARRFGVNHQTLRAALQRLDSDGLIQRRPASGNFVREQIPATQEMVAVSMQDEGHIYADVFGATCRRLQQARVLPVVLSIDPQWDTRSAGTRLQEIVDCGCSTLIMQDGAAGCVPSAQEAIVAEANTRFKRIIWQAFTPGLPHGFAGDAVITDWDAGILQVAEYLIQLGHRHIAVVDHTLDEQADAAITRAHYFLNGFRHTVQRLEPRARVTPILQTDDPDKNRRQMQHMLTAKHRPTAMVASQDWRLVVALDVARELGIDVPGELSLVGYLDTPWATQLKMSSVAIHPEELAVGIVDMLADARPYRQARWVKPSLVIRETSGPAPTRP